MNSVTLTFLLLAWSANLLFSTDKSTSPKPAGNAPFEIAEKVYLHVDRSYYNSGDDIWFKAYVIDASSNKPSENTNNLHVELISPDSRIIQNSVVKIVSGTGKGDFSLADSIPSGHYRIRAYTNHLRNYDDHFFFNKEIIIVNPSDGGKGLNDSIKYISNSISISFFPEGGSLVDNITSTVAFKAVNSLDKGCDITGKLFSSNGDLVSSFKSSHLGMGHFSLKPIPGLKYYAVITGDEGVEYRADIPESFSKGLAIHVVVIQDNKLLLKIITNGETISELVNRDLNVSISSRSLVIKTTNIRIASLANNYIIPADEFPDGILRVTLSGIDGLPLCERLVFFQKNTSRIVVISTDKQIYRPREKIEIKILYPGDSLFNDEAFLSLSASEAMISDGAYKYPTSISSWFLLESDVRGIVEEPSGYFDISNEARYQELDLLLLTQGWRDFQWKYDSTNQFVHEIGFSLSGRVRRIIANKPFKGAKVNIGILSDNSAVLLSTEPDSSGSFKIGGIDITGRAKAVVSVTDKSDMFNGWLILDSAFYMPAPVEELLSSSTSLLSENMPALKQEAEIKTSIKKKYKLKDTINIDEVFVTARKREQINYVHQSRSHYITPDKELVLTPDLQLRHDITSVLTGRIPGVDVTASGITVRGQYPLFLRDGIPSSLMEIDMIPPYMIDRIDVLYWSSLYGSQGANGIINVITRRGNFDYTEKPEFHSANITIKGFDAPRRFYSPKYSGPEPSAFIPDIRNTILWEPDIVTKKGENVTLSCFNSDKAATYDVIVEGLTTSGIPVTGKARYEVK